MCKASTFRPASTCLLDDVHYVLIDGTTSCSGGEAGGASLDGQSVSTHLLAEPLRGCKWLLSHDGAAGDDRQRRSTLLLLRVTGCPPPFVCRQTDYLVKKKKLSFQQTDTCYISSATQSSQPLSPFFNLKQSSWPTARLTCPCVLVMCCCLCFDFFQQHTHVGRFFRAIRPICCPRMSPLPEEEGWTSGDDLAPPPSPSLSRGPHTEWEGGGAAGGGG